MNDGGLITRAVHQALAVHPEAVAPPAMAKAQLCLTDAVRCMFEARDLATSRQALSATAPCPGGVAVAATDRLATPGEAAFAMATMSAGLLREDMHAASISHHGIVVWPTLLALTAGAEVSGARFLAAGVVGYEFGARLGAALFDADLARRLRPTAFSAAAGAAMAGAWLLGFDEAQAVAAVALTVDASSGLNQWPRTGGDEIFFQAGRAAQNAATACALARAGAFASPSMLDGEAGLFAAAWRTVPAGLDLFPGGEAAIMAVYNKALPICNFAQTPSQAALALAARPGFASSEVRSLTVAVTNAARLYPGCDRPAGFERALQAKMSIQFGVAAALSHGDLKQQRFEPPIDAETLRLAGLCVLEADPALTAKFPGRQGARVTAVLADGQVITVERENVVPATEAAIRDGLLASAGEALGPARAARLLNLIDALGEVADARALLAAAHLDPQHSAAA